MSFTRFSTSRGRPKSPVRETDYGTPELIYKRVHGDTAEAIDLCRERGLISPRQHQCALHLRWLYTLRYGSPTISALDLCRASGIAPDTDAGSDWRAEREAEYEQAAHALMQRRCHAITIAVCVHDERPRFLNLAHCRAAFDRPDTRESLHRELLGLQQGLEILARLWRT